MAKLSNLGAVILAAGCGRRMGAVKPLLDLGGTTAIERIVDAYRRAGVGALCAVIAPRAGGLAERLDALEVPRAVNPDPGRGMYSSVRVGAGFLRKGLAGFFVHPADLPLVRPETLRRLAASLGDGIAVVHPVAAGRRGHPPLLAASLRARLPDAEPPGGLRGFLAAQPPESVAEVEVADEGIFLDLDTPADYRRALRRIAAGPPASGPDPRLTQRRAAANPALLAVRRLTRRASP